MLPEPLPEPRHVSYLEMAEIAEKRIIDDDDLKDVMDRDVCISSEDYSDRYVDYHGVRLSIEDVRRVYDGLPDACRERLKHYACKLVALVHEDRRYTDYNFDNALIALAKFGLLVAGAETHALPSHRVQVSPLAGMADL